MVERRWWWPVPVYVALCLVVLAGLHTAWRSPPRPAPPQQLRGLALPDSPPACNASAPPQWVAVVSSAPNNSYHRHQIRSTWGRSRQVVFLLGTTSQRLQPLVDLEALQYGDIVQGSFQDSYRNLTYKHVMGLLWAGKHCPGAKYLIKIDDDVFVNTPFFENYLQNLPGQRLIFCPLVRHAMVKRSFRSKWRVSRLEFADQWYPPYCSGWVIVYTPDVAEALSTAALKEPYFWIDDVHITGTIAKKLNFTHESLGHLGIGEEETEDMLSGDVNPRTNFLFSLTKPWHFQKLWNIVNNATYSSDSNELLV